MIGVALLCLLSYFLGSIPFGLILAYAFTGKDIRKHGSGNIGATNAFRLGGKFLGVLTLLLDTAKGVVAVGVAYYCFPGVETLHCVCGFLVFAGHIFPLWLNFKGGKGVATAFGVVAMLVPKVALLSLGVWLAVLLFSRMVSLASILTSIFAATAVWINIYYGSGHSQVTTAVCITAICLLVILRHNSNIYRIINKKELKI